MTEFERYHQKMTETPVSRLIVSLGIPTTISMLITSIYNLADTYFVGTLNESAQAATGILFTLQAIIQAIAFMLGHGSGTYVSKSLADRNLDEASQYVSTAFFTGGFFGFMLTVGGLLALEPFMTLLGSTETILPYAKDYGLWVLISAPFMICSLILNNNLRYEGKAFFAMIGLTSGGLLNIFGDYLLISVFDLGVWGAGLSTAVSQAVSFGILLFFYRKMAQSKISLRFVTLKPKVYCEIVKGGLPSLIRQGLSAVSNGLLNNLAKPFGDAVIDAMSVVNRFSAFIMCVGLGIGQGFQPVSSYNFRVGKYDRVKKGLLFTTFFSLAFVGGLAVLGFAFSEGIIWIFQKEQSVIDVGSEALRFACIGVCFLPVSVPVNMLFQSIRKAAIASFLSLLRSGAVFIPVLLLTTNLFGQIGIEISQPIADIVTGLISIPFIIGFVRAKFPEPEKGALHENRDRD